MLVLKSLRFEKKGTTLVTAFVHYENVKDLESVYSEMDLVHLHYTHNLTVSFQPQGASTAAFKGLNTCRVTSFQGSL